MELFVSLLAIATVYVVEAQEEAPVSGSISNTNVPDYGSSPQSNSVNFIDPLSDSKVVEPSDAQRAKPSSEELVDSFQCLGCICQAATGCDTKLQCSGDICGPFAMTWPYWADGGKNTLKGESATSPTAYSNCANDFTCASATVNGYMKKYAQDCDGDGKITCYDYARIHHFGGYACTTPPTSDRSTKYLAKFDECTRNPQVDVRGPLSNSS